MPAPVLIGHERIVASLWRMVAEERLPQTLMFAGPRGVGKATLARHLAAGINCMVRPGPPCGDCSACRRVLSADLSKPSYQKLFQARRKLLAAKRSESPLVIAEHPDVLIFPPDGPMRIIGIDQARALRNSARLAPTEGRRRVFVIDDADRASTEAANALLKTLEEPGPAVTIVLVTENPYLLPPTIRSRSIPFYFAALSLREMKAFLRTRDQVEKDVRDQVAVWSGGCPGLALTLDIEQLLRRRSAMVALIRAALFRGSFPQFAREFKAVAHKRSEGLDELAGVLASLLRDLLRLHLNLDEGLTHRDIVQELRELSARTDFRWIERALEALEDLQRLKQLNIQKQIAVDAYALALRQ